MKPTVAARLKFGITMTKMLRGALESLTIAKLLSISAATVVTNGIQPEA
jgi:hypothetical protein